MKLTIFRAYKISKHPYLFINMYWVNYFRKNIFVRQNFDNFINKIVEALKKYSFIIKNIFLLSGVLGSEQSVLKVFTFVRESKLDSGCLPLEWSSFFLVKTGDSASFSKSFDSLLV